MDARKKYTDLVGMKFNRLTVTSLNRIGPQRKRIWNCACDCGGVTVAWTQSLTESRKTSCGCDDPRQYAARNGSPGLTIERLREVLDYEPETGVLRWRVSLGGKGVAGERAGTISVHGHRIVSIDGKKYRAARLCWMHIHGAMPANLIDHKNRVRDDDRLDNLREATYSGNARNVGAKSPSSGLKGAYREMGKSKFFSCIRADGGNIYLGTFDTAEAAHSAYAEASAKFHGEFGCSE